MWKDCTSACHGILRSKASAAAFVLLVWIATSAVLAAAVISSIVERDLTPYPHADRLVWLTKRDSGGDDHFTVAEYEKLVALPHVFADVGAFADRELLVTAVGKDGPELLRASLAQREIFQMLAGRDVIGVPTDTPRTGVILSRASTRRLFGDEHAVGGTMLRVDGVEQPIVGTAPDGWRFPFDADAWTLLDLSEPRVATSRAPFLRVLARLADAATLVEAANAVHARAQLAPFAHGADVVVQPLADVVAASHRSVVLVMQVAAPIVALAAVLNGGLLLVARAARARGAIGIRVALGAAPLTASRRVAFEVGALTFAGLVAGVSSVPVLCRVAALLPLHGVSGPWPGLVAYASATATAIGLGAVVAAIVGRDAAKDPLSALTRVGNGRVFAPGRLVQALVILQLAFAIAVSSIAALVTLHARRLRELNLAPDAAGVISVRLVLSSRVYRTADAAAVFYERVADRLKSEHGIQHVSFGSRLPGEPNPSVESLFVRGRIDAAAPQARISLVGPAYFGIFGIQILAGRPFSEEELRQPQRRPAMAIDAVASERLFGGVESAIGQQVALGSAASRPYEVVAVVRHLRDPALDPVAAPQVFLPTASVAVGYLIVSGGGADVYPAIRHAVHAANPEQGIGPAVRFDDTIARSNVPATSRRRLVLVLTAACIAIVCVGVAGLIASSIAWSEREYAVRMALGRSHASLIVDILAALARRSVVGVALGAVFSIGVGQLVASALPGSPAWNASSFALITLTLVALVLGVGFAVASRSLRVDPGALLRTRPD